MFCMHSVRKHLFLWLFPFILTSFSIGCASEHEGHSQTADDGWSPTVSRPEFSRGGGPAVLVDAAHGNFHTVEGRFSAFAKLLELDGYRVQSADTEVTEELLDSASIFVISNAVYGGDDAEWTLPTASAFTLAESRSSSVTSVSAL